jgi:hypothetical protein
MYVVIIVRSLLSQIAPVTLYFPILIIFFARSSHTCFFFFLGWLNCDSILNRMSNNNFIASPFQAKASSSAMEIIINLSSNYLIINVLTFMCFVATSRFCRWIGDSYHTLLYMLGGNFKVLTFEITIFTTI